LACIIYYCKLIELALLSPAQLAPKTEYINENLDLFYTLYEVEDLHFGALSIGEQEALMQSLVVEQYGPGDYLVKAMDASTDMFFVVASDGTKGTAEVEVVKTVDGECSGGRR
jgi:hypothetical protein